MFWPALGSLLGRVRSLGLDSISTALLVSSASEKVIDCATVLTSNFSMGLAAARGSFGDLLNSRFAAAAGAAAI